MSSINPDDIRWNDEARAKILEDSDRVLREAVVDVASSHSDGTWEDAFAELNARLKDQFIDFEPGPDLRRYAEAIVAGDIDGVGDSAGAASAGSESAESADAASTGGDPVPSTSAESSEAETASAGGSYADQPADQVAADAGAAVPATPETDGSAESSSGDADGGASSDAAASGDAASGGESDGTEAPNETIDDPNDPTVTDEPSA